MPKRQIETVEIAENGNTIHSQQSTSSRKKQKTVKKTGKQQGNQLIFHFLTWNNYPPNALETLETTFRPLCKKYIFQEETGENEDTPHIQGNFQLLKKMRWSEFNLPKELHWEKTRNPDAAFKYCEKNETRTGEQRMFGIIKPRIPWCIETLYPWQQELYDILKEECEDRRTIHWYWSDSGNIGKSEFVKYCRLKLNSLKLTYGKTSDLINLVFNANMDERNIIMIDIPRNGGNKISYNALEEIKNGYITNTKYETDDKIFKSPHIAILANVPPDTTSQGFSADRWHIVEIKT